MAEHKAHKCDRQFNTEVEKGICHLSPVSCENNFGEEFVGGGENTIE